MEDAFIKQLKHDIEGSEFGSKQEELQIWYNQEGDCVQFKTMHVATIAKRIDEYLTLYISIEDNKPIGFQLKDIHALANKYDVDLTAVQADYTSRDKRLVSITTLMFQAFVKIPKTTNRVSGYSEAFRTIARDAYNVEIPV
jgi:hypothetical protein